jgi:hypothetical protein
MSYFGRTVGPLHLATPTALCRAALANLGAFDLGRRLRAAWAADRRTGVLPLSTEPSGS